MDHGAIRTNSIFRTTSDTFMDLNFTDELLVQRYWWESAGGVNFLDPEPSISNDLCDPSQYVPFMGSGHLSINSHHRTCQEETDISLENPPVVYPETEEQVVETITSPVHSEGSQLESGEFVLEFCESWECPKQEPEEEETLQETTDSDNNDLDQYQEREFSDFGQLQQNPEHCTVESAGDSFVPWSHLLGSRKTGKKRQTKTEKTISLQVLRKYFAGSLKDAAKSIGVCPTTLKRMCRQYGISRWPSRKIKKVNHSLKKLQHVVDSVMGAQGLIEIDSFYTAFPELSSSGYFGHNPFSSFQITEYPKESNPKPINHLFSTKGPVSKSQSSSRSQNSGLFICHGKRQLTSTINGLSTGHALAVEDPVEVLKRTRSKSELPSLNKEELDRAKSNETSCQHQNLETQASLPINNGQCLRDGGAFRIKATFGDENIRFSLQPNWGFRDLQREIAKRFEIDDFSRIGLKYLDNDHESILLTCDADLEECKDLLGFSQSRTIKITLYLVSKPNLGSSFSSSRDLF
uniref:RWP-RK domain-containing protein n=1 Tax=Populus trichocarpa TaxID=3694 RepID=A0A3N7FP05_POPTR|eukprot:XP_024463895.1 protein NLP2 [Populus trichocarpa]